MEIKKQIAFFTIIIISIYVLAGNVYADVTLNTESGASGNYCNEVKIASATDNTYHGFDFKNQGYRITLLDNSTGVYSPKYILDLINGEPNDFYYTPSSHYSSGEFGGSYGFYTGGIDNGLNINNHEINEIFRGCMWDVDDHNEDIKLEDEGFHKYGDRVYNEEYSASVTTPDGTSITTYSPIFTEDYVTGSGNYTINQLLGDDNYSALYNIMEDIKGQCKLFYVQHEKDRYLDRGFNTDFTSPKDKVALFDGFKNSEYYCSNKSMLSIASFNNQYGTNIPAATDNGSEEFFLFRKDSNGMYASFYDKEYINDPRFLMSLYKFFMDNYAQFDAEKISEYSLMFEPIVWCDYMGSNGYYHVDSRQIGWEGRNPNKGCHAPVQQQDQPEFSFYGTLTELAYIQMDCGEETSKWRQVIGFPTKEFWIYKHENGDPKVVYQSGALLYTLLDIGNYSGAAMMLTGDTVTVGSTVIQNSESFLNNVNSLDKAGYYWCNSGNQLHSQYIVNNLAVAVLQYNPPITYDVHDYTYRTNTEVVSSIKLINHSNTDFLPSYASVQNYENGISSDEPVAVGAILTYSDENGNALTPEKIGQLGLPDFVSVQGIGSSQNFNSATASANETYLYFKWKTPEIPMKLTVTARLVGYNSKNPIYVNHEVGSNEGREELYNGKKYTTVTFVCDIKDTIEKLRENNVPPDNIGGFMNHYSSGTDAEQYNKNVEIYNNYQNNYKNKRFDMSDYLPVGVTEDKVENLTWVEYTAKTNGSAVALDMHEYKAVSWLEQQKNTETWINGGKNPIVIPDDVPKEIYVDSSDGNQYRTIPSGYGFSFAYEDTYNGRVGLAGGTGFFVSDEDKEVVKNACTMFQNGIILFPEYGYNTDYVRTVDTYIKEWFIDGQADSVNAMSINNYSLSDKVEIDDITKRGHLKSRVHFIPVWFPDKTKYEVAVIMFDYWCPAGQLYDYETYSFYVDGNVYEKWYVTKSDANQG